MVRRKKKEQEIESSTKEWYLLAANQQWGPYSLMDLRNDPRLTPDTLVWKKGYKEWTQARFVVELQKIFKDKPKPRPLFDPNNENEIEPDVQEGQLVLAFQQDPYQFILWLLLLLIILFYTSYYIYFEN